MKPGQKMIIILLAAALTFSIILLSFFLLTAPRPAEEAVKSEPAPFAPIPENEGRDTNPAALRPELKGARTATVPLPGTAATTSQPGMGEATTTMGLKQTGEQPPPNTGDIMPLPPVSVPASSATSCSDSDNGLDYYRRGTAYGPYLPDHPVKPGGYFSGSDICQAGANSQNILIEHYCRGGYHLTHQYSCPDGCRDGVCLKATSSPDEVPLLP